MGTTGTQATDTTGTPATGTQAMGTEARATTGTPAMGTQMGVRLPRRPQRLALGNKGLPRAGCPTQPQHGGTRPVRTVRLVLLRAHPSQWSARLTPPVPAARRRWPISLVVLRASGPGSLVAPPLVPHPPAGNTQVLAPRMARWCRRPSLASWWTARRVTGTLTGLVRATGLLRTVTMLDLQVGAQALVRQGQPTVRRPQVCTGPPPLVARPCPPSVGPVLLVCVQGPALRR